MAWTPILDHIQQAKDRLLEQQKKLTSVNGMVESLAQEIQELEDMYNALSLDRALNNARGVQLDRIGAIVGLARVPGQDDADYLLDIKAAVVQNMNQGTPEEIIAAAKYFIGATYIWYQELKPAAVEIYTPTPIVNSIVVRVRAKLQSFLPAGVSLDTFGYYDPSNVFRFNSPIGLGDVNIPGSGSFLAGIYADDGSGGMVTELTTEDGDSLTTEDGTIIVI